MKKNVKVLGSIVIAAFMYCVPVIFTCSFAYNWNGFYKLILLICAAGQFVMLVDCVLRESDYD